MSKPYMEDIVSVMRTQTSYGFVKDSEVSKVEQIVESYLSESLLIEKEIAYNQGFVDGIRSAKNPN
jgi:hypothetical protein